MDHRAPGSQAQPEETAPTASPGRVAKLTARLIGLLPVAAVFLVIALSLDALEDLYEAVQAGGEAQRIDGPVHAWMLAQRTDWLNTVVTGFTHLGGTIGMPILAGTTIIALTWWWRTRTPLVLMVVAVAGSLFLTTQGKTMTGRARPPLTEAVPPFEHSPSFPSGHTLNTFVIATVLAYLVLLYVRSRRGRILTLAGLVVFSVLMGTSRIYLGHHWLTDVLAGAVTGIAWALAACIGHWIYVRLRTRHRASSVREVAQEHRHEVSRCRHQPSHEALPH